MIKVKILREENKISYLEVSGHADYGQYGRDLVCAGVSAIAVGALNNLNPKNFIIKMEDGFISIEPLIEPTYHDQIVLETLIVQLKTMEDSYSDYISIN